MSTLSELSRKGEAALDRFTPGWKNEEAIHFFNNLAEEMRSTRHFHAGEKIVSMEGWAEILYSAKKHRDWDQQGVTGVVRIKHFIRCDLHSMRSIERQYLNPEQ